jgi:hypothetical protein
MRVLMASSVPSFSRMLSSASSGSRLSLSTLHAAACPDCSWDAERRGSAWMMDKGRRRKHRAATTYITVAAVASLHDGPVSDTTGKTQADDGGGLPAK